MTEKSPPLCLAAKIIGQGPAIIMLHGLFGHGGNWNRFMQPFAPHYRCHLVDLRNHGDSPWAPEMDYLAMASDLERYCQQQKIEEAVFIGHSMGGKAAMALALQRPDLVDSLFVIDIAPVSYPGDELARFTHIMRQFALAGFANRQQIDKKLAENIPDADIRAFLLQNIIRVDSQSGWQFRWRLNLPVLCEKIADISGFPDAFAQQNWSGRAFFLAGEKSSYIRHGDHRSIRQLFPRATIVTIANAGHWIHTEQPEALRRHIFSHIFVSGEADQL